MKTTNRKRYEAPKAEIIEIGPQGILCASAGGGGDDGNLTGTGFQFGTSSGSWGFAGNGFEFGTSGGSW